MLNTLGKFFGVNPAGYVCGNSHKDYCVQATCYASSGKFDYEKIRHEFKDGVYCNGYQIGCC